MNKLILLAVCLISITSHAQKKANPLNVEKYTLKNGLTIYLNEDPNASSVVGLIGVKGGSKRDPKDATGIAHYFEHIMFKGTDKIGTTDYNKEKIYLDSISEQYDNLSLTTDKKEREIIQLKINELSIKAAEYAIPNEFNRIISKMGGDNLNAFTSPECIAYFNTFPPTEMEKWLKVYSHRFENPVFRLFQSELETVYEEKNLYADDMGTSFFEAFMKEMYKGTPYGDQTIIGSAEHLKNPSLSKMKNYFDTYYVPNNMALVLTGNFNSTSVKPLIEENFGRWKYKELPNENPIEMKNFKGRQQVTKRLLPIKVGILGFKTTPVGHPDEIKIDLCNKLLSNYSSTGLLDELTNNNKLMEANCESLNFTEFGSSLFIIVPKIFGQSLKSCEQLILDKLEKLKSGDFSDDLLEAVKLEMIIANENRIEDNKKRISELLDAFLYDKDWDETLEYSNKLNAITKEDVIKTAQKYYANNYLAFYSKMGFPKKDKIAKPPYKPIKPKNTEAKSEYAEMIENIPSKDAELRFIEEGTDFEKGEISEFAKFYCSKNPINNIFSLKIKFHAGSNENSKYNLAENILEYCGTKDFAYADFKKEMQKLGTDYWVYSNKTNLTFHITGIKNNLAPTLKLINSLFVDLKFEEKEKEKIVNNAKLNKKYDLKDIDAKSEALKDYALYKNKSFYLKRLNTKEIKKLPVDTLVKIARSVVNRSCELHYCGSLCGDDFKLVAKENLSFVKSLTQGNEMPLKSMVKPTENTIYFIHDKNAVQSHINLFVIGNDNDAKDWFNQKAFNAYFGSDMSSIVFQEIREFRSLAYSASGYSKMPYDKNEPCYFKGVMSTQADKTIEALDVYNNLLSNMPEKPERIDIIKKSMKQSINGKRPEFRNITRDIPYWKYIDCTEDPNKKIYNNLDSMSFDNVMSYYNKYIKDKKVVITIVGNKKQIDFEKLSNFGTIKEIKAKDVFNF